MKEKSIGLMVIMDLVALFLSGQQVLLEILALGITVSTNLIQQEELLTLE
jgi:hypothetical protein